MALLNKTSFQALLKGILVLAMGLFFSQTASAQVPFGPRIELDTNFYNPQSVDVADLNGDGHLDAVAASMNDGIKWYENHGNDSFTSHILFDQLPGAMDVHVADLDKDGDMDVVVAFETAQQVNWFENDGSGNFTSQVIKNYSPNQPDPQSVYAADINNNNQMDVAAAFLGNKLVWYENDSSENFTEKGLENDVGKAVFVTELMGNDTAELIFSTAAENNQPIGCSGDLLEYFSDNPFPFTSQTLESFNSNIGCVSSNAVTATDINDDGATDIIASMPSGLFWYDNNQSFSRNVVDSPGQNASGLAVADFNQDNLPDIAASYDNGVTHRIALYSNSTNQNLTEQTIDTQSDGYNSGQSGDVQSGDLAGNGLPDILFADGNNNTIAWRKNLDCPFHDTLNIDTCNAYTVPSGDTVLRQSTVYSDTVEFKPSCDSIFLINLTIDSVSTTIDTGVCQSYTVPSGDTTLTQSTFYTDTLSSAKPGCDSLIFINLSVDTSVTYLDTSACYSFTVPSGDTTLTESGLYTDTLVNQAGCDSLIHINLALDTSSTNIDTAACYNYTVPSGDTILAESTFYTDTLVNSKDCDSLIHINLSIDTSSATIDTGVCQSYTVPSGDTTLTTAGSYIDTLVNSKGCDSLIFINLSIDRSEGMLDTSVCESFTVPSEDTTLTASTTYIDTLTNNAGCDSLLTINFTKLDTNEVALDTSACIAYEVPSGDTTLYEAASYTDTLTNEAGCDSLVHINLTEVIKPDTSVLIYNDSLIATGGPNADYQWLICDAQNQPGAPVPNAQDSVFKPEADSFYALAVTQDGCTDTSDCHEVNVTGIDKPALNQEFKVYPNPTTGQLKIDFEEGVHNARIKIIDQSGKVVRENTGQTGQSILMDLSGLQAGGYIVEIEEEGRYARRAILKR